MSKSIKQLEQEKARKAREEFANYCTKNDLYARVETAEIWKILEERQKKANAL